MRSDRKTVLSLGLFIAALFAAAALKDRSFLSVRNFTDVAVNTSYVAIAGMGMLLVILSGQIDVSVGAILAVTSSVAGALAKAGVPVPAAVLASVVAGLTLGTLNGLVVVGLGIHSIVATLGMLCIYRGLLIFVTHGGWISGLPAGLQFLGRGKLAGVPVPVLVTAAAFACVALLLRSTRAGRDFYAVGSSEESARLAGIPVRRVLLSAFVLDGALVGLAGAVFAGRFGSIQSNSGQGFELTAIAAVVVGGADIFGGSGSPSGTLLGAVLVSVTGTLLLFFDVSAFWEQAIQGAIILFAVAYYTIRQRRRVGAGGGVALEGGAA